jgi:hypothetical protein
MTDPGVFDIETVLRQAAADIDVSGADRVLTDVLAALPTASVRRHRAWTTDRILKVAAAVVVALLVASLVFSSGMRHAVARLFGLDGIRIETVDTLPPATAGAIDLGDRVDAAAASAALGGPLHHITDDRTGTPLGTYAREGAITTVYGPNDVLPTTSVPGVGLLFTELRADIEEPFLKKVLGQGTQIEAVDVGGHHGYWIEGAPHGVLFLGRDGEAVAEPIRLAGNVLLWQNGDRTMRIEAQVSKADAIALAESVR